MTRNWTFGQRVGAGFALTVALALCLAIVAIVTLRSVVTSKDQVINVNAQLLVDAERACTLIEGKSSAGRAFLLTREERWVEQMRASRGKFAAIVGRLKAHVYTDEGRRLVDSIEREEVEHQEALERAIALRRTDTPLEPITRAFDEQVVPKRDRLYADLLAFSAREERLLQDANRLATEVASTAITVLVGIGIGVVALASAIAIVLTRALTRQIGTAIARVQSSSAELQAAASQQASGAKEQSTAMSEISTTISELLATSRQIAESAQRVSHIADQTAGAVRAGDATVDRGNEAVLGIRRQVDVIVTHMLELGKKSQQIGAVLDIVSELAEQTNILAINATIEAAGAGEGGKRFSVVADEIRKLADRVAGSTKEVRGLIDDVRSAVNTTVMTTETGSKAVELGSRQFSEVATAFRQITSQVTTANEAAREIQLSTKQQATAVEQVNVAITSAAQATKETEASTGQTLRTASELSSVSEELLRLVQPDVRAAAPHLAAH